VDAKARLLIEQLMAKWRAEADRHPQRDSGPDHAWSNAHDACADELDALLQSASQLMASELAWPQDVVELIEMADDWPLLTTDAGDMFSGDVLIKKLGHALKHATSESVRSVTPQEPVSEFASEAEYQNHLPWCKARLFGRLNRGACNCDLAADPPEAVRASSMADAAEMLWVVLANVSGGDWTRQSPEWQEAAARWRDNYFAALKTEAAPPPEAVTPQEPIRAICVCGWEFMHGGEVDAHRHCQAAEAVRSAPPPYVHQITCQRWVRKEDHIVVPAGSGKWIYDPLLPCTCDVKPSFSSPEQP
jgi:hypothetical protein